MAGSTVSLLYKQRLYLFLSVTFGLLAIETQNMYMFNGLMEHVKSSFVHFFSPLLITFGKKS